MLALLVSLAFAADTYVELRPEVGVGWGSYGGFAWRLGGSLCAEYRVIPALGLIADAGGWKRSLGSTLAPPMSQDVLRARVGVRGYFTERPSAGFVDLDLGVASRRWLTDREVARVDLVPVVTPHVGFRLVSRGGFTFTLRLGTDLAAVLIDHDLGADGGFTFGFRLPD